MGRIPSSFIRWLQPLEGGLWVLFLFWTAGIALVWAGNVGDHQLESAVHNADLRKTIEWLVRIGDIAWFTLAALNIHGSIAETEGIRTARRWALIACGGGLVVAVVNALGVYPLEKIVYGSALGMKFGPAPLGVMLLWFVIVIGAREAALRAAPKASHAQLSISTGLLVLLTGINLEPIGAQLRGFWFWTAVAPSDPPSFSPPLASYAVWLVFGTLLAFLLREDRVAVDLRSRSWKPVIILGLLNAVFLLAHLGRMVRG